MPDPLVISGAAVLTRFGASAASWEALREGRSGGRLSTALKATVAEVEDTFLAGTPDTLDRCSRLALVAAREACAQAGLRPGGRHPRLAVVLGSARPGEHARVAVTEHARTGRRIPGALSTATMTAGPAFAVGTEFGAGGPVFVTSGTCASSALAVVAAMNLIQAGLADTVITGGAESCLSEPYLAQTAALRILSATTCRPFDEQRDGTWLGEGAGILVLQRASAASGRIRAALLSAGVAFDGAMLADEEGGEALEQAVAEALKRAGIGADSIDAVQAHAAGTRKGDAIEAAVLTRVLGSRRAPVSSSKASFGHTLGASGGIELALAVKSLERGIIPPTANLERPDPQFALDLPRAAQERPLKVLLKTASAMGGLHAALLLGRP